MRTWLAKFRISTALDSRAPRGEQPPRAESDPGLRAFGESIHSLDRRLKASQPTTPVPHSIHESVMRAVRAAVESDERPATSWVMRWLPAPGVAVLVIIGLWWTLNQPPQESPSLAAAATALEQSHGIAQKAPEVVLAPLAQEMNNLNRDFQNAVEFLVASVP